MLQTILADYFRHPPQGDQAASIRLDVATHRTHPVHDKFRASDAGKCRRMRYWKRQGKEGQAQVTLETFLALQTGNLLHAFLQYALKSEGVLLCAEAEVTDAHRIGHIDAIIDDGSQAVLYDFKIVNNKQMYYQKQDGQPKPEHVSQVLTYVEMFSKMGLSPDYTKIQAARVAYLNRDTLELVEYPIDDMRVTLAAVDADWNLLRDNWERQELPPKTAISWKCKYCAYAHDCA